MRRGILLSLALLVTPHLLQARPGATQADVSQAASKGGCELALFAPAPPPVCRAGEWRVIADPPQKMPPIGNFPCGDCEEGDQCQSAVLCAGKTTNDSCGSGKTCQAVRMCNDPAGTVCCGCR